MQYKAASVAEYLKQIPEERQDAIKKLRKEIKDNLPEGFEEQISYGMIGYVVPHSLYPPGYHCDPKLPLPFLSIASQKNFIAVYHMGIYANKKLLDWFVEEYARAVPSKLDMGKSCMRFKKPEHIPFTLIGKLAAKLTPQKWIEIYEDIIKR